MTKPLRLIESLYQCMNDKYYGIFSPSENNYPYFFLSSVLGHNGAGKTTMINNLTGMLRFDDGNIFYGDQDFATNYEQIRKTFGLCVQKDILYDELTVEEHIEMILRLRGTPNGKIPQYLADISQKVTLK